MKLPKHVQVGAIRYTVRADADAQLALQGFLGKCRYADQELLVSTAQGQDQTADTLLHEVLHACFCVIGKSNDEKIIGRLTPVLLDVLRRNPKLVEALT